MTTTPTILIVPGLRDHVAEHWQTLLEQKLLAAGKPARSVQPLEHDKLSRDARVAALDQALAAIDGPVILVAHSAGVMITVHWAQQHTRTILGALLAAPADLESPFPPGYPSTEALRDNGWLPIPRSPLPFPSIVVASTNDPLGNIDRVAELADAWGSRFENIGAVGHLNPAAGFGEWPLAESLIRELETQATHIA
ncbi:RBBP9/YdeN family alpha/beta hydrolase [Aromatoleum petrolei]|uniref:Alpha/beta hydrolase n=1 Tax=Aromatoleum petrolei TaxID=76116 RepID=A0ABX1N0S3_9RHOO|nr:alpha/beta hydrolase [Aromatoleum petrolei]NMF91167.1 alpha/beta hydrolase [Aromatoleum petrolei]QTQ34561.1 Putative hydrolase RBBP9/YdeN domain-containing protein [Aromatoleum petrolei]